MLGPGKYELESSVVREATGAAIAIVIIIDGHAGHGFSMQVDAARLKDISPVPAMLRAVAAQIEQDIPELQAQMLRQRGKGRD